MLNERELKWLKNIEGLGSGEKSLKDTTEVRGEAESVLTAGELLS